jgi:hypothetical protein
MRPQFLDRLAVTLLGLTLNLCQRYRLQAGFSLKNTQGGTRFNALDLLRVTAENDSGVLFLSQFNDGGHLPCGDHSCLVYDDHGISHVGLRLCILQQPRNRHGFGKPDFLKFLYRAHRWSGAENLSFCLRQAALDFLKGRGPAGPRRAAHTNGPPLFRPQPIERAERDAG